MKYDGITVGRYAEHYEVPPYVEDHKGCVFLETSAEGYGTALIIGRINDEWWYGWVGLTKGDTAELNAMEPDKMAHALVIDEFTEDGMSCGYFGTAWEAIREAYTEEVKDDDELLAFIHETVTAGEK